MGNYLAFASVTATITYLLEEVNRDISGIKITAKPLDAIDLQNPVNGINVFLYFVAPYPALDSIDTLVKDSAGNATNNPVLALDLHYLVTATSSENNDFVAQKILASAMRILNEHPVLSRDLIRRAVKNNEGLELSDLADQLEDVKLNLNALSPEDLSKIWSRFPSSNFRPSVGYTANVVILESKLVGPATRLRSIAVDSIGQLKTPHIQRIEPLNVEFAPDVMITIIGENLKASSVSVGFNDSIQVKPVAEADVSDKMITTPLSPDLEPGILKVNVNHYLKGSEATQEVRDGKRPVLKSNTSPFVLAPKIVSPREGKVKAGNELVIDFVPPISVEKRISVLLGDSVFIGVPVKSTGTQPEMKTSQVKIQVPKDFGSGTHLLRISVDGADSHLVIDGDPRSSTFKKAIEPYVEIVS